MLQALGRSRIIVLVVLVLLNGSAGYGLYEHLMPMRLQAEQKLASAKSELEQKRQEIQRLKEEYALLQSQLRYYKDLQAKGFFNDQGRVAAQEVFEKLRTISGVLKAKYDISAGTLINDPRATDAGYVILNSPIKVELDSLDDVDVYSFLKLIQERFPGKVDIVSMNVAKKGNLTGENVKSIGKGDPVALVTSTVNFQWKTMASQASISPDTAGAMQSASPDGAAPNPAQGGTP